MAIVVITMVDLQCCRCRPKITKILECLKDEFSIEKIEFEDKLNKVIVRGKFDGEKLKTTILCKAGKIVKKIAVVKEWPPPAPPPPPPSPECMCKCKVVPYLYPASYPFPCCKPPPPPLPPPGDAILVITMVCLCCACRGKITKILEGLKGEFCIEKIEFEDKLCKVIVRGKFDGEKLKKTISDKAGSLVKERALVDKWPPPPPPPPTTTPPPPPPPKPECKVVPYPYPYPYPYQPPCHCCKPPPKKEEKKEEKPKEEKKEEKPKCCCRRCCKCECPPPKEPEKPKPPPCKCVCECSHEKPPEKPKPPKDENKYHCPPCPPYWPPPQHCHCPEQDSQCSIM